MSSQFMYPNVTSLPGSKGVGQAESQQPKKQEGTKGEFDHVLEKTQLDLDKVKQPLKMSAHAAQRLQERKIALDPTTMAKVNDAIDKAAAKGVEDTLVITDKAALIVSVKNRTVITALDKGSLSGNVFTNIDGAVIV
jgi:flagellar operon protein